MSMHERTAWISFVSMALTSMVYFGAVGARLAAGQPVPLTWLVGWIVAMVILQAVVHAAFAIRSAGDAGANASVADERDRIIELKATRAAFFVLVVGALTAIGTIHLGAHAHTLAYAVLAAIAVAELARTGGQIVGYRRGSW